MVQQTRTFRENRRKMAALFLIAALVLSIYTPIPVQATTLKEEVVYIRLHNDGSVDRVYVVNSFQLGDEREILDYGNYAYVQNLSGNDAIKLDKGKVTTNARGDRLHYEGFLIDPQLPWNIAITYRLNGREISPDKLAGKKGHLAIKVETGPNHSGCRDFFESYALQLSLTFKDSLCKNIRAEGGSIVTTGDSKQANFVILPGKSALSEVNAEVEDFEMPAITIAGIRLNMDFNLEEDADLSEINELTDGIAELDDGVKELLDGIFDLHEGVSDFNDGSAEMADGAGELTDGAVKLVGGVRNLDKGVGEFAGGIGELYTGIGGLLTGTNELYSGLGIILDGSEELTEGAQEFAAGTSPLTEEIAMLTGGFSNFFDGLLEMANAQLAGSGLPKLEHENYHDILRNALDGELIKNMVYAEARQEILARALADIGIDSETFNAMPENEEPRRTIEMTVDETLASMAPQLDGQVETLIGELSKLLEMLAGYDQLLIGLNSYVAGVNKGARDLYGGISGLNDGLLEYHGGMEEYLTGMKKLYRGSSGLVEGANKLKDGTGELLEGMIEFKNGMIKFENGIIELKGGTGELLEGTTDLYDGVAELKEGTFELRRETSTMNDDLIDAIKDRLQEMMGGENPVKSFVSEKNGEISAVQFLMQTEGIARPKTENTEPKPEPRLTFWQRFIRLFGF